MEQRSALPSINGNFADQSPSLAAQVPDIRPASSLGVSSPAGRRAFGIVPKSAVATSTSRRTTHTDATMTYMYGNQAQRPSSTQVSRRASADRMAVRVFTSTTHHERNMGVPVEHDSHYRQIQQQDERLNGPEGFLQDPSFDPRDDVQQLRDENAVFRHENDQLRTQLVEKMRGQSKVVAGGQFRAASASASKVPISPSSVCTKCVTARAKAIKAHHENEQAQAAAAELRKYVDKVESRQQQLWEDRNTRVVEIVQLRDKLTEKVEECLLFEAECTKLNKQVKMLQSESEIDDVLTEVSEVVDEATQCVLQQSCDDEIRAAQLHEIATLKEHVQLMTNQLNDREQELKKVSADIEESQKIAKFEKEKLNRESKLRFENESEHKRRVLELERSLAAMGVLLEDQKKTHQKELHLIQETNQELRSNITSKESTIQALGQQHKSESAAREKQHQTLVTALKVRIEQKIADVNRFRALVEKQTAEKDADSLMRKRVEDFECQVQALMKEKNQLAEENAFQQQRVVKLVRCERDKVQKEGSAEMQRLSDALHVTEQHNRSIQTRISEVETDLAEQVSLMQKQTRSHARALEGLLVSSLRLCVVAPTVNVQLNTNGSNLAKRVSRLSINKAKDNDPGELISVMCRSAPQQDSIKRVIENDVLPLFTSVFLQGDDNSSPQGDVPMTRWLQDLLHDMQVRIAAQLESIYSTASVKASE